MITPAAVIEDRNLLGAAFAGDSWLTWRAVLKAAYAEPLDDAELALFRGVAERNPPGRRVRELVCIAGRRAGKDSIASAIAVTAALGDYRSRLRPGERASVLCLAVTSDQARIVHRYVSAAFLENPLLKPLVARETDDGLELTNGVEIVVATNSFRTVRGRTIVCAILDETAFWKDDASANPDEEVYSALVRAMITMPEAMLIMISTPYRRGGLLFRKWRESFGKPDDDVLVVKGASTTFNPSLPQRIIDADLALDPEKASAEWLAEWRSDLADYVDRQVVEAAVQWGLYEIPPVEGEKYVSFVDPSGGKADAFTLAIGHRDKDDRGVLDLVREIRAPLSPAAAIEEYAGVLKQYRCMEVTGDRYAAEFPVEQFRLYGIEYLVSEKKKSDLYRDFLPILNSGKVELLDHPRLIAQLCGLERRTFRGGQDSIDHPVGGHDDLINAVAGCITLIVGEVDSWAAFRRHNRAYFEGEAARAVAAVPAIAAANAAAAERQKDRQEAEAQARAERDAAWASAERQRAVNIARRLRAIGGANVLRGFGL